MWAFSKILIVATLIFTLNQVSADDLAEVDLGRSVKTDVRLGDIEGKDSSGNADVVSQKDISRRTDKKFSETLRGISGVEIPKGRGMETFDTIKIRGISGGVNVLVDGVSINDINNNTKMLTSFNALDLERVEVVRGPFSSLYGSGALGGVVNFITKMPERLEMSANIGYGNPFINNQAPQNLVRGYFSIGDVYFDKALRVKASYGFATSKGYAADDAWVNEKNIDLNDKISGAIPSQKPDGTPIYIVGDMGRQAYANHDARLRAQLDIGDNDMLDFNFNYGNYNYRHKGQKTFLKDENGNEFWGTGKECPTDNSCSGTIPYAFVGGMGNEAYHQFVESLKYSHFFDESTLEFSISRLDGIDDWIDAGKNVSSDSSLSGDGEKYNYRHKKTEVNLIYNMDFKDSWQNPYVFIVGGDYKLLELDTTKNKVANWKDFNSKEIGFAGSSGGKSHFIGAFVDLRGAWLDSILTASLGGRFDYWLGRDYYKKEADDTKTPVSNNDKFAFSPKLSLNYNPLDSTSLKFSLGQAFRVPTLSQMLASEREMSGGSTIAGNPNLKPETATSFDIGIVQKTPMNGEFKTFYFFTHLANVIYNRKNGNKSIPENGGTARIQGIEISYKQPLPLGFGIYGSYTFTDSKMLKNSTDTASVGKPLPDIPTHLGYVQVYYEDYGFLVGLSGEFASKPASTSYFSNVVSGVYGATDGYYLFDVKLGYKFNENVGVNVDFTNIFNHKYYNYYRAPGAAFFASVSVKL